MGQNTLFYSYDRLAAAAKGDGHVSLGLARLWQYVADAERVYFHGSENMQLGFGPWNERGDQAAATLVGPGHSSRREPSEVMFRCSMIPRRSH